VVDPLSINWKALSEKPNIDKKNKTNNNNKENPGKVQVDIYAICIEGELSEEASALETWLHDKRNLVHYIYSPSVMFA
jgi:hypothetical protein